MHADQGEFLGGGTAHDRPVVAGDRQHITEPGSSGFIDRPEEFRVDGVITHHDLGAISEHPSHFVRWAAIQAVGRLDRARAVELLRRSLEDAHPHVRSMAAKVLAKVGIPNG